jgi:hypothetical protein
MFATPLVPRLRPLIVEAVIDFGATMMGHLFLRRANDRDHACLKFLKRYLIGIAKRRSYVSFEQEDVS